MFHIWKILYCELSEWTHTGNCMIIVILAYMSLSAVGSLKQITSWNASTWMDKLDMLHKNKNAIISHPICRCKSDDVVWSPNNPILLLAGFIPVHTGSPVWILALHNARSGASSSLRPNYPQWFKTNKRWEMVICM